MENKHANDAGSVWAWRNAAGIKFSPIVITAALSVILFLAAIGWRATRTIETTNAGIFSGSDKTYGVQNQNIYQAGAGTNAGNMAQAPIPSAFGGATPVPEQSSLRGAAGQAGLNDFSHTENDVFGQLLGTYVALKNAGTYTEEKGAQIANSIAEATVASVAYTAVAKSDIKTDADISSARILVYRRDLEAALAPLLLNSESELGIFNDYVQTRDRHALVILEEVAGRYRKTVALLSAMTVPEDALTYHLGVTNSLLAFATTLDAMIKNADDPMATLALLRAYNAAEENVYTSFSSLASYEKRKIP